jgi:hypothetical protein
MTERKKYDAVFAGCSLTSLAAAAALARKGRSVLVLAGTGGVHFPSPLFQFAQGPLLYLGFEEGGAMEGFFSELPLPIPNLRKEGFLFKRVLPFLQIVQSRHRIDLSSQNEEYLDELKREFGPQLPKIKSFFQEIEKETLVLSPYLGRFSQVEIHGLVDRLTAWKQKFDFQRAVQSYKKKRAIDFLSPFGFDDEFLEYLHLQSLFAFRKPLAEISTFDLILLIWSLSKGGVRMVGGSSTLVSFFIKLIKGWGGEVVEDKTITQVETKGKRIDEVVLEEKTRVSTKHLIMVQPPSGSDVHFCFTLRNESIPSPMKESLLMSWGEAVPAEVEDLLVLRLSLPEEEGGFTPGVRGLVVTALLRPGVEITEDRTEVLRKGVLDRLQWLMPFSKSQIEEVAGPGRKRALSASLETFRTEWIGRSREVSKGTWSFLQPKDLKNVLLLKDDLSDHLAWGASFMAATSIAQTVDQGL